jgi:OmpA-OmpF porin, OOP family
MKRILILAVAALVMIGFSGSFNPCDAQLGGLKDKIKKKAEEKATKKVEDAIDKKDAEPAGSEEAPETKESAEETSAAPASAAGTASAEDMTLYTKYDFVPGDRVILYDDYAQDEIGEFPSRWGLVDGVFEVVKQGQKKFIMCTDEGSLRPKTPAGPLPPKYTFEVEFYSKGPEFKGHWYHIYWMDAKDNQLGNLGIQDNLHTNLRILEKDLASKQLAKALTAGVHTMRIMATTTTLKCYIDNERVANVPAVDGFLPVSFRVHMDPWKDEPKNPMLLGTIRYAEGGKTLRQQLDEAGKIVTHGILFDSGSAKIKAESYKTLADIGGLLTEDAALRLSIEGHTDSDGADDANLKLSEDRAAAVKTYLIEGYKVDAARLEVKGLGETKPIDANATPEGKANNRRVELVKL